MADQTSRADRRASRGDQLSLVPLLSLTLVLALFPQALWPSPTSSLAENGQDNGPVTVRAVLSAPFPSAVAASSTGELVAWVSNAEGIRNIFVAEGPGFEARALTDYQLDDGQELTSLVFSPDGNSLAFVRGGPPNARGELPNPISSPEGVERAVYVASLARPDTPTRIHDGSSPLWGPGGSSLLFLNKGKVMRTTVQPGKRNKPDVYSEPEPLIEARGAFTSIELSPDEGHLSFTSNRDSHSFVGIYDFTEKAITYLDPSLDRDGDPVFSPDGRKIAFRRLPATADRSIFAPRREAQPWSIRIVDLADGSAREIWRAEPGVGSVFSRLEATHQLFWTDSDHIVFPWERDGFKHLWAVSSNGGGAENLTPGAFEVEFVAPSPNHQSLVYSSNQDDIDRRHLWRVTPGGRAEQITDGEGVENAPAVTPLGAIAFVAADGRRPLQPRIRTPAGQIQDLASDTALASFPLEHMIEPEQVIFRAADGMTIHGQLFEPPPRFEGKRPAAIFFHGGSRRHMMLGWHYSSYYHNCYAFHQYLASQGYVVLSVNYRSGIGYGLEFREALNYGATGASEFNDVLGAGLYMQSHERVSSDSIGVWGGSYGGYLTAMALSRASDLFAAGVDIHGVHDWNKAIKNFVPSYNELEDEARTRLAFESSPMSSVATWRSPVLLVHGDDDRNVPFKESIDLVEQLRARDVETEILVFPDEVHGWLLHSTWVKIFEHAADFFARHLPAVTK